MTWFPRPDGFCKCAKSSVVARFSWATAAPTILCCKDCGCDLSDRRHEREELCELRMVCDAIRTTVLAIPEFGRMDRRPVPPAVEEAQGAALRALYAFQDALLAEGVTVDWKSRQKGPGAQLKAALRKQARTAR